MNRFTLLLAAALPLLAAPAGAASLVQYEFTGQPGTEASVTASAVDPSLTALAFTRGPGLTGSGAAGSISASGFSTAANDYFSFGFTLASGVTATVSDLLFGAQSSATGPGTINVLAFVDGATTGSNVGTFALTTAGSNLSQRLTFATPLVASRSLELRFVAANNTAVNGGTIGTGGTFRVTDYLTTNPDTPFTIDGTVAQAAVAAVPEPAAWVMMIAGVGLAGAALRRRAVPAQRFA